MTNHLPSASQTHPMLSSVTPQQAKKGKVVSAKEAVQVIRNGDTIATGTPAGIGPMQPGDAIEVEVEGIGVLANTVVAEPDDGAGAATVL